MLDAEVVPPEAKEDEECDPDAALDGAGFHEEDDADNYNGDDANDYDDDDPLAATTRKQHSRENNTRLKAKPHMRHMQMES